VDLAPLPPDADPAPAVAAALDVRHAAGANEPGALADILAAALSGPSGAPRRLLLVLDNCEHVVDGAAALADLLLRRCPGLTLLATSREALGVEGEVVWPVGGLSHPPRSAVPPAAHEAEALAASLDAYDAVRLFVERARAAQPSFALTARTAPAVAAIAARLDGLPLALELAAAQVAMLGVDQLAVRLDDVFAVLTRGRRTALPRHRTLRALLDWSYHLLAPAERALLARLSVFRSGFSLDAAAQVCAAAAGERTPAAGAALDAAGVFESVGRLVEQSLVQVRDERGEVRYTLLEPIRQYGAALLTGTPDEAPTRDRHLAWAAVLVTDAEPRLLTRARWAEIERLSHHVEDLRAAVHWAATASPAGGPRTPPHDGASSGATAASAAEVTRAVDAMLVAGGLTQLWVAVGAWDVARRLLDDAHRAAARIGLSFDGDPATEAARAAGALPGVRRAAGRVLFAGAGLALLSGRFDAALAACERALAWLGTERDHAPTPAERREAEWWRAFTHLVRFEPHLIRGDVAAAEAAIRDATAAAAASDDEFVRAYAAFRAAALQALAGDVAAAAAACERVLPYWRVQGYPPMLCTALHLAADLARGRGDQAAMAGYAREAIAVVAADAQRGDLWSLARSIEIVAVVCADSADRAARSAGEPHHEGSARSTTAVTSDLAAVAAGALDAARLLGAASALRTRAGITDTAADVAFREKARHAAETLVGGSAYADALAEGARLTNGEMVALATRALAAPALVAPALAEQAPATRALPPSTGGAPPVARAVAGADARAARLGQRRPGIDVQHFGPLLVTRDGVQVPSTELTPAKVRELLLYLALHPEGRTKEQIALAIWPDASPAQVRSAFHVTMHQLRRALGRKDAVTFDGGAYALARDTAALLDGAHDGAPPSGAPADPEAEAPVVRTDVDAVLAAAEAVRAADRAAERARARGADALVAAGADAEARARWRAALARAARGPLGEGEAAGEWLAGPAGRVGAAWAEAMEALARLAVRAEAPGEAVALLEALVAAEPLREGAHRLLMAAYVTGGEPARALAHYDALAALLAREVGAAPGRETRALAATIRGGAGRTL
jgi:predicted ATPase/DNA-binding SARP family transcriptional activator